MIVAPVAVMVSASKTVLASVNVEPFNSTSAGVVMLIPNALTVQLSNVIEMELESGADNVRVWFLYVTGALGVKSVTASGAVTGASISDGTATLSAGTLGAKSVTVSGAVTGASISDGTATLNAGVLSGLKSLSMTGVFTVADVETPIVNVPVNTGAVYFGGVNVAGSWRIMSDGSGLNMQVCSNGSYTTRHSFK